MYFMPVPDVTCISLKKRAILFYFILYFFSVILVQIIKLATPNDCKVVFSSQIQVTFSNVLTPYTYKIRTRMPTNHTATCPLTTRLFLPSPTSSGMIIHAN